MFKIDEYQSDLIAVECCNTDIGGCNNLSARSFFVNNILPTASKPFSQQCITRLQKHFLVHNMQDTFHDKCLLV